MAEKNNNDFIFEDISSSSSNGIDNIKKTVEAYGNGAFKHIDKIIKIISFVVSISMLLIFIAAAVVLFMLDDIFTIVAVGVLIVGTIVSAITLFLIYAIGHIISQNNEILKRL